jgi:hypothetical protein
MQPPEEWESPEEEEQALTVAKPNNNWATKVRLFLQKHWQPTPIAPPTVDPSLPELSGIERSAEVIRHSLLSAEYWLAPNGWLRAWFRLNFRLAVIVAIPAFLIVPLVTFALGQFSNWAELIAKTSTNLLFFPLTALLMVGLISALIYFGNSRRDPRDRHPYY